MSNSFRNDPQHQQILNTSSSILSDEEANEEDIADLILEQPEEEKKDLVLEEEDKESEHSLERSNSKLIKHVLEPPDEEEENNIEEDDGNDDNEPIQPKEPSDEDRESIAHSNRSLNNQIE